MQETQKPYAYLGATYRQNDNYTDIYDGMMAKLLPKKPEATKQTKDQRNNKTNTKNKTKQTKNYFKKTLILVRQYKTYPHFQ